MKFLNQSRKKSVKILKKAVKDKTLACYDDRTVECNYYDSRTDRCCAVGQLIPKKHLKKHMDNGRCQEFLYNNQGDDDYTLPQIDGNITSHLENYEMDEMFGLDIMELTKLQNLHDKCINQPDIKVKKRSIKRFEEYVNSLQ